jgi:hypothetical protein
LILGAVGIGDLDAVGICDRDLQQARASETREGHTTEAEEEKLSLVCAEHVERGLRIPRRWPILVVLLLPEHLP